MAEETTRLAVALKYLAPDPPTVVATGRGHVAEAILARARESGVPVEENPLLAGALAALELDERIPEDLYRTVAAVVAMVIRASREADAAGTDGAADAAPLAQRVDHRRHLRQLADHRLGAGIHQPLAMAPEGVRAADEADHPHAGRGGGSDARRAVLDHHHGGRRDAEGFGCVQEHVRMGLAAALADLAGREYVGLEAVPQAGRLERDPQPRQ
jgi:flagellar biosynthesis protein